MINPAIRAALDGVRGNSTHGVLTTNEEAAQAIEGLRRRLRTTSAIADVVQEELGAVDAESARAAIAKLKSAEPKGVA